MEMDEENATSQHVTQAPMPTINTALPQQPFRSSAPATPSATQAFQLFGNPTVSSVNTPTLSTQSASLVPQVGGGEASMQSMNSSDSASDFNQPFVFPTDGTMGIPMNYDFSINQALQQELVGLTIHDPANRLATGNTPLDLQQQLQLTMNNAGLSADADPNIALQQAPLSAGLAPSVLAFPGQEEKKYRCPVIGCEKAYKNQNGLKYHKGVSRFEFQAPCSRYTD
jgi:transcription factor SFP1